MNHTRYLDNNKTVCEYPQGLDQHLPVVLDYDPDAQSCNDCYSLVFTHNEREFQKEQMETLNRRGPHDTELLRPFRGIVYGCVIGSAFWIIVFAIFWAVFCT